MVQKISPSRVQSFQPVNIPHSVEQKKANLKESGQTTATTDRFDRKSNDDVQKSNVPKLPDMVARITTKRFPGGEELFKEIFGKDNVRFEYDDDGFHARVTMDEGVAKALTGHPDNLLRISFKNPGGVVDIPTKTGVIGSLLIDEGEETQLQVFQNKETGRTDFFFVDSNNEVVQQIVVNIEDPSKGPEVTYLNLGKEKEKIQSANHRGIEEKEEKEDPNESYRDITGMDPEFQRTP